VRPFDHISVTTLWRLWSSRCGHPPSPAPNPSLPSGPHPAPPLPSDSPPSLPRSLPRSLPPPPPPPAPFFPVTHQSFVLPEARAPPGCKAGVGQV
jgi:hypothetical protein